MMTKKYKDTIRLPKTAFAMKANLPAREPALVDSWKEQQLFKQLRAVSKGKTPFILHDGPPYANGNIHIGTALNKILKDIINRSFQMRDHDANYVPGWDCHGLPIEWKIEEQYRAKGKNKNEVPILEFRKECRDFAQHWLDIQREEFKRLGVFGDWDSPYSTMNFESEAIIAAEIHKFLMSGALYQGSRPVMWSVVEQTALAEAELEYYEHKSPTITVAFPIISAPIEKLVGANLLIWTTTPWTIPANRAIACNVDMDYVLVEIEATEDGALPQIGARYLLAASRLQDVLDSAKITAHRVIEHYQGADIAGLIAAHPWRGQGYDQDTPLLAADFVTDDQGTGFVHIAPGHGADDWALGKANGLEIPTTVLPNGQYREKLPLVGGATIIDDQGKMGNANGLVIKLLMENGKLFSKASLRHKYPHSWRSKAPLIFLNTPQWFIALDDQNAIRGKALKGIDDTVFYPDQGRKRLYGMIENRPDWCISRQRAWGVPIALFVDKETQMPLRDNAVNARIYQAFLQEGGDAWYKRDPQEFLGDDYDSSAYDQVFDVVDVWFDSGSTHAFCLEPRSLGNKDLTWPADLYLEGSDQHRGWFHSSLLEACATRGKPPFKAILTHGFVLAQDGLKMSKSLNNQMFPQQINDQYGADILRLWVVGEDYFGDVKIGNDTLKQVTDYYRRLRNSLRWLLGNLSHKPAASPIAYDDLPLLEQWVMNRLGSLNDDLDHAVRRHDHGVVFRAILQFCTNDLSALYFDVRKDVLYCDAADSPRLAACYQVLEQIFDHLIRWLAPILVFTAEEAYLERRAQLIEQGISAETLPQSVHLLQYSDLHADYGGASHPDWPILMEARRVIFGALEQKRADKIIGASLEAAPSLLLDIKARPELKSLMDHHDFLKNLVITSDLEMTESALDPAAQEDYRHPECVDMAVHFHKAQGSKCPRCWVIHQDDTAPRTEFDSDQPLCKRCDQAI